MASVEYKVEKLNARNYSTWRIVVESHLKAKGLWSTVLAGVKDEGENEDEFLVSNEAAKHTMYVSMEPQQIAATGTCELARDLWLKIKENHEGAEANLRSSALAEFLGLKHRKNETLVSFAGRFELSLGKLQSTGHTVDEKTKIWVFSNSLPNYMKQTVHMFNMANPSGTVAQLISQLKVQFHMDNSDQNVASAFHTEELEKPGRPGNNQRDERNQWGGRHRNSNGNHSKPLNSNSCTYCKRDGHIWRECRKLKNDNQRKKSFAEGRKPNVNGARKPPQGEQRSQPNKAGAFTTGKHECAEGRHNWIVDSGASNHMTPHREYLTDFKLFEAPRHIYVGNGERVDAIGAGRMPFTMGNSEGELKQVLFVPQLSENLFSVGKAMALNCNVEFNQRQREVRFYRDNDLVLVGKKKPGSPYFILPLKPSAPVEQRAADCALLGATVEEWHRRFGHCSTQTIEAMVRNNAVDGLTISNQQRHDCPACILGKLCRASHASRSTVKANDKSAVLHIDTVGPLKVPSLGGSRYFVLATEEYSGFKFIEPVSTKDLIPDKVKAIINCAELEGSRPVKAIETDRGSEFVNHDLIEFCNRRGVLHFISVAHTPQQNGRAERANRTVLDGIRTLLADSKLPEELWAEAACTMVYTSNRLIGDRSKETHYELFTGKKPNVSNLHRFGQPAYVRRPDSARDSKLSARAEKAVFVGYTDRFNTFRFYTDEPVQQVFDACDVRFVSDDESFEHGRKNERPIGVIEDEQNSGRAVVHTERLRRRPPTPDSDSSFDSTNESTTSPPLTRSRARQINQASSETDHSSDQESFSSTREEIAFFTLDDEPRTYKDASESDEWPQWHQAMQEEIEALNKNKTWELVNKPPNVKPIKNKWVYKVKLKPDGQVERFKARLVAKGYSQIPNIDYKETYAPVASMNTVRMFLAIANQNNMRIMQFDIKTAFLYGDLDEQLYMEQPEGFNKGDGKVCKLVKSLYGLKQAPRNWNRKFDQMLKLFSLEQASVDRCLYFNKDRTLLLAIYVDDGLAAGSNDAQLEQLIDHLKSNFELKVMACESYLGFKIVRDHKAKTLSIVQDHYVDKMLEKFGMEAANPVSTPEQVGSKFTDSPKLPTENKFKELVGSLLYLATCSRPDISHAVSKASQTSEPTQAHWAALKRILRYLKGTKDFGIRFRRESQLTLVGYSDADYANDEESRKSTTGLCIMLGGAPIAWRSQRQPIITLSTTEAEYVAGCELVKELLPIREQLIEVGELNKSEPTAVYIDNQSAVRIATNEGGQSRTKHIDIRAKWLTEQAQNGKIIVNHISGDDQAADILTKPLYTTRFMANRSKLLTQIITTLSILAIACSTSDAARHFRFTDPLSTKLSDQVYIKGDTRYKLSNLFANPCETLFKYSNTLIATEKLMKNCNDYYKRRIASIPTACAKLPTIGPDLDTIPPIIDCVSYTVPGKSTTDDISRIHAGKCEITRRLISQAPPLDIDNIEERWSRHKKRIDELKRLSREKRFIPIIASAALVLAGISLGGHNKAIKLTSHNAISIEKLTNRTNEHTEAIIEASEVMADLRNTDISIRTWAQEIEERLDEVTSIKGARANLSAIYIDWIDAQHNLLTEINWAASKKQVPPSIKPMLNLTDPLPTTNWSTLFECSHRLINRSLILNLDFSIPTFDQNMEILEVVPMSFYSTKESGNTIEYCWNNYIGPIKLLQNKTDGCLVKLDEKRVLNGAVRAQTCTGSKYPLGEGTWEREGCTSEAPRDSDRIQINDLDGLHKIYCFPFDIDIEGESEPCPMAPFAIPGHVNYNIGNLSHSGSFIDTEVTRHIRSTSRHKRSKRSPVGLAVTTTTTTQGPTKPTDPPPAKQHEIVKTIDKYTGRVNASIAKIQTVMKRITGPLNITRAQFESIFNEPLDLIGGTVTSLMDFLKTMGVTIGIMSGIMMMIALVPILELIIVGLKVAKLPANLWLGSARRVTCHLRQLPSFGSDILRFLKLKGPIKKIKHRWDGNKIV